MESGPRVRSDPDTIMTAISLHMVIVIHGQGHLSLVNRFDFEAPGLDNSLLCNSNNMGHPEIIQEGRR